MFFTWEALAAEDGACKRLPENFNSWLFTAQIHYKASVTNPPVLYGKLRHRFHTNSLRGFDYTLDEKSAICKSRSTSANTFSEKNEGNIF